MGEENRLRRKERSSSLRGTKGSREDSGRKGNEETCLGSKEWSTVSTDTEKSSRVRGDTCPEVLIIQRPLLTLGTRAVWGAGRRKPDYSGSRGLGSVEVNIMYSPF